MIKRLANGTAKLVGILSRWQIFLGIVVLICSIVAALLETLGVSVIIPLVNAMLEPQELWKNGIIKKIADILSIGTDRELVIAIICGVIIIYVLKNVFFVFNSWINVKYANKIQRECSIEMMSSYMKRGYLFFLDHNVSELRQGIDNDVLLLYCVIINVFKFISQALICVFICIFMAYTDWKLACGVVIAAVICVLLIVLWFRKRMTAAGIEQRKYEIKSTKVFLEMFYGIKEVLITRSQRHYLERFEDSTIKKQNAQAIQAIGNEIPAYIIEAICITGIMIILSIRLGSIDNPKSFVATLAAFAIGAFRVLPALGKISSAVNTIEASLVGMNSVYVNIVEARQYDSQCCDVIEEKEEKVVDSFEKVELRNIVFSYGDELPCILNDISIDIPSGKAVAFVGESGAGKSTLADIILGVLRPKSGRVMLDGVDTTEIPSTWSKMIGFVPQSIYLADATVAENVAYGEDEDRIDYDRVREKLKLANLLDFVESLPNGVETQIGDRGVKLSGGQRQRIGIARALYRNPKILVLDEATSALDTDTEQLVMEAIDNLHGTMTLIIIAHRLTTIKNCDYIYEIREGKAYAKTYSEII